MSNTTQPISYAPQQGKPGHSFMAQLFGPDGQSIAVIESTDDPAVASDRARRLAAAWNACVGISTESLEKGAPLSAAFQREQNRADSAEARCDELQAALREMLIVFEMSAATMSQVVACREATAKLNGNPAVDDEPRYYLQDTSGYVGNCPLWWGLNSSGYTIDLRKAHRYTFEEAMKQHRCRGTDLPWLCSEIDQLQRLGGPNKVLDHVG